VNQIVPHDPITGELVELKPQVDPEAKADFDKARETITALIDQSMVVSNVASQVAISSQDAKSLEAYSRLIGEIRQAAQDLMDVRIKYETAVAVSEPEAAPQVVNNNLFVGSADDFLKRLKPKQADDDSDLDL
jgi:hypothetical protein